MTTVLCLLDCNRCWSRRIIEGVARHARSRGDWHLTVMPPNQLVTASAASLAPPAAVIGSVDDVDQALQARLKELGAPVVNVSGRRPPPDLPAVLCDNHAIGRMGADYLLDLGYRHFAFVGVRAHAYARERRLGFESVVAERQADWQPGPDVVCGTPEAPEVLSDWLRNCWRPLGIMAASDTCARDVETACLRVGLRVPDDVALLGVNNDRLINQLTRIPLTSVDPYFELVGIRAAQWVQMVLDGHASDAPRRMLITPRGVITRRSAACLAIQDPILRRVVGVLREQACRRVRFDALIADMGYSRRTLERRFKDVLHCTPHDIRRRARLNRGCELLLDTDEPINRISASLGYCEAKIFAREFRLAFGATPRAWRQRMRLRRVERDAMKPVAPAPATAC